MHCFMNELNILGLTAETREEQEKQRQENGEEGEEDMDKQSSEGSGNSSPAKETQTILSDEEILGEEKEEREELGPVLEGATAMKPRTQRLDALRDWRGGGEQQNK